MTCNCPTASKVSFWAIVLTMLFVLCVVAFSAQAQDKPETYHCPPGYKSCKVIFLSPEEEQSLTGANAILDHALWANRAGLSPVIEAWRRKLAEAPAGVVDAPKPEMKNKPEPKK